NHGVGIASWSLETVTYAFAYIVFHMGHFTRTEQIAIHHSVSNGLIATAPVVRHIEAPRLDTRIPLAQGKAEIIFTTSHGVVLVDSRRHEQTGQAGFLAVIRAGHRLRVMEHPILVCF